MLISVREKSEAVRNIAAILNKSDQEKVSLITVASDGDVWEKLGMTVRRAYQEGRRVNAKALEVESAC